MTSIAATPPTATAEVAAAAPARPDVFVSYSRKDQSFVRRLVAALQAVDKDVWVDWEDIRKSADWHADVRAGVESAKTVVAVLSPDFATSEVCAEETAHAVLHNKRLVPIVRRPVDRHALRSELTAPNWIFFDDDAAFDAAFADLVEAIETDIDWLDQHARLLVRALEWERAVDDRGSLLLRGADLRAAEAWVSAQGSHREAATLAQIEYIFASRRAATLRQRAMLGSVVAALLLVSVLAVLATVEFVSARRARDRAIAERKVAVSRQLATEALTRTDANPELGLLLAGDAIAAGPLRPLPAALVAVQQAWNAYHQARILRLPNTQLVGYSSVRDRVLTTPDPRSIRLTQTGAPASIEIKRNRYDNVWLTPDGRFIVAGSDEIYDRPHAIWIWRARDGSLVGTRPLPMYTDVLGVSSTPGRIVITYDDGKATVLAARTLSVVERAHMRYGGSGVAYLAPDGTHVAMPSDSGITIAEEHGGRPIRVASGAPLASAYSRDGRTLFTVNGVGTTAAWRTRDGHRIWRGARHPLLSAAAFSPAGRSVAAATFDGRVLVWRTRNDAATVVLGSFPTGAYDPAHPSSTRVGWSSDGRRVFVVYGDVVRTWRLTKTGTRTLLILHGKSDLSERNLVVMGPPIHVLRVYRFERQRLRSLGAVRIPGFDDAVAVSPDGAMVAAGSSDEYPERVIDLRRTADGNTIRTAKKLLGAPASFAHSEDTLLFARAGQVFQARLNDWIAGGRRVASPFPRRADESAGWGEFSADDRTVLVLASVDTSDGPPLESATAFRNGHRIGRRDGLFTFVALSPDGNRVVMDDPLGRAEIWNSDGGHLAWRIEMRGRKIVAATFSPDSRRLATLAADGTVGLWDVSAKIEIGTLERIPHADGLAFGENGLQLLVASPTALRLVTCVICRSHDDLVAFLVQRASTLDLSAADRTIWRRATSGVPGAALPSGLTGVQSRS